MKIPIELQTEVNLSVPEDGVDFKTLEQWCMQLVCVVFVQVLEQVLRALDEQLKETRDRARYQINDFRERTVETLVGPVRIYRRYYEDVLKEFEKDEATRAVLLVGEIGGTAEEEAAEFIKGMSKPVVAYLAGKNAPSGKRMGHAGAIVERGRGSFASKVKALASAGVKVAELPWQIAEYTCEALAGEPS
jgi:hypothetical protein